MDTLEAAVAGEWERADKLDAVQKAYLTAVRLIIQDYRQGTIYTTTAVESIVELTRFYTKEAEEIEAEFAPTQEYGDEVVRSVP